MKFLLDFLPIALFFGIFKWAEKQPEQAANWATQYLGGLVAGGIVGAKEAPILLATAVAIVVSLLQVAYLLARKRKVEPMLWMSLGIIVVFGGATIWLHSETFIKWKPTVLYWLFALILVGGRLRGKNLLQSVMGQQITLPAAVWQRLSMAWIGFFMAMGLLNLYVAFTFPTDVWVNFKLFGGMGLLFVFAIAQGLYLSKHLESTPSENT